ncbi:MAG: hypothetical protein ACRC2M_07805 [Planktothrix sp.]
MPIIPSNWSGQNIVNATGLSDSGGFPVYQFAKSIEININELESFVDLIGTCNELINREISLKVLLGNCKLYWKNLDGSYAPITTSDFLTIDNTYNFVDTTLGQLGLAVKCSEITELFLVLRWDKDVSFDIIGNNEVISIPQLLTVINNIIYIDDTLGALATEPLLCTAYFNDISNIPTPDEWKNIYLESVTDSAMFQVWQYNPNTYTSTFIYPTINNPYIFNINPWWLGYGGFLLSQQWSENDPIDLLLKIKSFDLLTNTFILGIIE